MRLSKRQLKRIIREEYSRLQRQGLIRESLSTHPMNAQLGGKIGNRSGGTIDQQVRELVNVYYSLDQGYDEEEITDANNTYHRLESEMSPSDFKQANKIADLCLYHEEYATQADVYEVVEEIEAECAKLGLTAEDVLNLD